MKTIKIIFFALFVIAAQTGIAQVKTEKFKVSGECGMCKNKIEKAAKTAGATYALWNENTKELTVKYNSESANKARIQQGIAQTGYDTPGYKATEEAYNSLHACCKYERTGNTGVAETCCSGTSCTKEECKTCCADGKCTNGGACCKDGKCTKPAQQVLGIQVIDKACCKKS